MDLQSFAPGMRRCANGLGWAILALCALGALAAPVRAQNNFGLGPLSIRNQFPVTLAYLTYTPEAPATLPSGTVQLRYQFELTNTFINTQSPRANNPPVIDSSVVSGGLTPANFPATGYGAYIDVEARRHVLRLDYGLSDSLQAGLELAWVSFGGGFLDTKIQSVERFFGGLNKDRLYSGIDQYDFYVVRDGSFLRASNRPFSNVVQDPVLNLKWNLGEGGPVLPALTLKLSYKAPLQAHPTGDRALVASGGADWGYYVLLSKAVGDVVGHIQLGETHLDVAPNTFANRLRHRMFGLEFRLDSDNSFLLQSVTQSSIYLHTDVPGTMDFNISRPTDVMVVGYKHLTQSFLFETGAIEDYNQQRNESDITLYFSLGSRW
ncbi:MAG TPA: DUF3187 family protein [bacterium]|nr:DUF3187 family protein [bacterium]